MEVNGHVPRYKREKMNLYKREKSTAGISWSVFHSDVPPTFIPSPDWTELSASQLGQPVNRKWNWEDQTDGTDDNEEIIMHDGESDGVDGESNGVDYSIEE